MLLLLERHELTVSELCAVLQLPQSTVSRHLKTLADAGWVASRARWDQPLLHAGAGRARRRRRGGSGRCLREQVGSSVGADQDARRLKGVLAAGRRKSEEFFASSAGQWDRLREELFGDASHLHALPGAVRCATGSSATSAAARARPARRWRRLSRR